MTRPAPQPFTADAETSLFREPEHGTWISAETLWAVVVAVVCSVPAVAIALWELM